MELFNESNFEACRTIMQQVEKLYCQTGLIRQTLSEAPRLEVKAKVFLSKTNECLETISDNIYKLLDTKARTRHEIDAGVQNAFINQ